MKLEFSQRIFENPHIKFPEKSVQMEPSYFIRKERRKNRRKNLTKLIVGFRNFAEALKNLFRPTVLCRSHTWANLLVLTLAECQLLLKCTALASAYEI